MRIAYLLHWSAGRESGVFKKILQQATTWLELGHVVRLFVVCRKGSETSWVAASSTGAVEVGVYTFAHAASAWVAGAEAVMGVRRWKADVVYEREHPYYPGQAHALRGIPRVVEINGRVTAEAKARKMPFHRRLYAAMSDRQLSFGHGIAGLVYVTDELRRIHHRSDVPYAVISNGIDLAAIPVAPPSNSERPSLVFVGSPNQPWQGVDKIILMARAFPDWQFDLIGPNARDVDGQLQNVKFHGVLDSARYGAIVSQADVAIGSLALHRTNLNEACPLKTREYLARGLPVIVGYKDSEFPRGAPYILQLPNTENNILPHREAIRRFVLEWRNRRVDRSLVGSIDVRTKEIERLRFFGALLRNGGGVSR